MPPNTQDPGVSESQSSTASVETTTESVQQSASVTAPTKPEKGTDWESRFKGLQDASQKKADSLNTTISDLKSQIADLSTELEKMRGDSGTLASEKESLEKAQSELQEQLQSITVERDNNNKQLEQLKVVMGEFPQLSQLSQYIPQADDLDGFRENAKTLNELIENIVQERLTASIKGASPPIQQEQQKVISAGEEDALWERVYKTAGVVGKEDEYRKAYGELQALLAAKQTN